MSAYEPEIEEALRRWSIDRYAALAGPWRRGIKWYAPRSYNLPESPEDREEPFTVPKIQFVDEFPDGSLLLASQAGYIIKMDRKYNVEWEWGRGTLASSSHVAAVVNWSNGRILISDNANDRILEYDPATDSVTLTLDTFEGVGSMTSPRASYTYDGFSTRPYPSYTGEINVADPPNHYVAVIDRSGNVQHSFGTYGTAGDGTDLDHPMWLFSGGNSFYRICDRDNERVVQGRDMDADDVEVLAAWPLPSCTDFDASRRSISSVFLHPVVYSGDGITGFPSFTSEYCVRNSYTKAGGGVNVLGTNHGSVWEQDLRAYPGDFMKPLIYPNSAGESADTKLYVIPTFGFGSVEVQALSTAADTLHIYALKTFTDDVPLQGEPDASGNLQWQEYDSVSLTADTLEPYSITNPVGVMAVRVTGTGTVDLRAHLEP